MYLDLKTKTKEKKKKSEETYTYHCISFFFLEREINNIKTTTVHHCELE